MEEHKELTPDMYLPQKLLADLESAIGNNAVQKLEELLKDKRLADMRFEQVHGVFDGC